MKLYTKADIDTKAAGKDADFVAIASTGVEDRHGEVVSPEGWDLKAYKQNPVLLWGHDHTEIAVGQAKKVWVEGSGKRAKLMIEGFIHEATDKARALKYLVKEGVIKTMSVGFRPIEEEGNTYVQQELLEVSFVNVPANQQSMITAYKGLASEGFASETISKVIGMPVEFIEKMETLEKEMTDIKAWVKALKPAAPNKGRTDLIRQKQSMVKVIVTASDRMLAERKRNQPLSVKNLKVIKRASENLSALQKKEL